jgi:hypothetical protein
MKLSEPQKTLYSKDRKNALEAQRLANEIAQGPIVFQVSRLMLKFGIFQMLDDNKNGLSFEEIIEKSGLSKYAVKVLLESSLTIGTILLRDETFFLSKTGWFLIHDEMVRVDMNFNHDVNYLGWYNLEKALINGKPEGLKVFGDWATIYEGLSQLPPQVQESWFRFDHFYSDNSFQQALEIVFAQKPKSLLDVGGNTGRWATQCVKFNPDIYVTIMDLPQQIELMREATKNLPETDRILDFGCNLLDKNLSFPTGYDVIWMSQFLDCFSEEEVTNILERAAKSMDENSRLYIMETFWDRQRFETASFALAQISLYFTALANGNSKMYHSQDMERCIENAGLELEKYHDGLGFGHSIMICAKSS